MAFLYTTRHGSRLWLWLRRLWCRWRWRCRMPMMWALEWEVTDNGTAIGAWTTAAPLWRLCNYWAERLSHNHLTWLRLPLRLSWIASHSSARWQKWLLLLIEIQSDASISYLLWFSFRNVHNIWINFFLWFFS